MRVSSAHHARCVDQDLETAKVLDDRCDGNIDRCFVRDIEHASG